MGNKASATDVAASLLLKCDKSLYGALTPSFTTLAASWASYALRADLTTSSSAMNTSVDRGFTILNDVIVLKSD